MGPYMKILGLDFESTGLDTNTARIIEVGACVFETDTNVPIQIYSTFISDVKIMPEHEEALKINRIKAEWLDYGVPLEEALMELNRLIGDHHIEYVMAHNGNSYDKPLVLAELNRLGLKGHFLETCKWLDSKDDLPFMEEPQSRKLRHLALDAGFINFFEHRAIFDVMTMLKIAADYKIEDIIEQSKIPWVIIRALVDYDNREKAKEMRFSWENIGEKKFPKCWVKKIRENLVEIEQKKAEEKNFKIVKIENLPTGG